MLGLAIPFGKMSFMVISVLLAILAISSLIVHFANVGASVCWKNTIEDISDLKKNLDRLADPFELSLDATCVQSVVFTNEKNKCSNICYSSEYNGDVEDCLEKCGLCAGTKDPKGFIIAVPRISTSFGQAVSEPGQELRERLFNKIVCHVSAEYNFANEEVFDPLKNPVNCLTFRKLGDEYIVTNNIPASAAKGACNYV